MLISALALAALQTPLTPAPAGPPGDNDRLRACIAQVRTNPAQAAAEAQAWLEEQGARRLLARRCLGLAYAQQEQWAPAATVYEQAAQEAEAANDPGRAGFRAQAGNAWLAAGEPQRALQALDGALTTVGLDQAQRGQALLDRARAQVATGHPDRARSDLDSALQLVPGEGFAWYLSAALARRANDMVRATSDIARARQLSPDDPDVLLLAGTLVGQAGNMNEAYTLYRRVVELAPDSDAGRQAAASLATVREIEVDAPAAGPAPTQTGPTQTGPTQTGPTQTGTPAPQPTSPPAAPTAPAATPAPSPRR
jgi:tetratricopeptide (TPR) repeat protein